MQKCILTLKNIHNSSTARHAEQVSCAEIFSLCERKHIAVCYRPVAAKLNIYPIATFFYNHFTIIDIDTTPTVRNASQFRDEHYPPVPDISMLKRKNVNLFGLISIHIIDFHPRGLFQLPPFILFFDIYRESQLSIIHGCSNCDGFLNYA